MMRNGPGSTIAAIIVTLAVASFGSYIYFFKISADAKPEIPKYKVTLYASDGKVIKYWYSNTEYYFGSDNVCDFHEADTGNYVRITGTIAIEKVDHNEMIELANK